MAKVIARFSGIVSYADGSHDQFAVHLDERGNLSYNSKADSKQAIKEVDADFNWLDQLFALLPGITFNPSGTAVKTVTGLTAELSGRVSVDDPTGSAPTWEDFLVQYTSQTGAYTPSGHTSTAWARAKTAGLSRLNAMFDSFGITVS